MSAVNFKEMRLDTIVVSIIYIGTPAVSIAVKNSNRKKRTIGTQHQTSYDETQMTVMFFIL